MSNQTEKSTHHIVLKLKKSRSFLNLKTLIYALILLLVFVLFFKIKQYEEENDRLIKENSTLLEKIKIFEILNDEFILEKQRLLQKIEDNQKIFEQKLSNSTIWNKKNFKKIEKWIRKNSKYNQGKFDLSQLLQGGLGMAKNLKGKIYDLSSNGIEKAKDYKEKVIEYGWDLWNQTFEIFN